MKKEEIYFISNNMFPDEQELVIEETSTGTTYASKVILFNDEWHTFEEVIDQIIKAVSCGQEKAESITWEVHSRGKACVYEGDVPECLKVSSVLEEISLHTSIEF